MRKMFVLVLSVMLMMCSSVVFASDIDSDVIRPTSHFVKLEGAKESDDTEDVLDIPMEEKMPETSYTTMDGESADIAGILKDKAAIVIYFFVPESPSAADDFAVLAQLKETYGDQAAFLALDYDLEDTEEDLEDIMDVNQDAIDIALEEGWVLSDTIPFEGYSCIVVLDKNGNLVFYQDYALEDEDDLKTVFDAVLADDYESGYQELHQYVTEMSLSDAKEPESKD